LTVRETKGVAIVMELSPQLQIAIKQPVSHMQDQTQPSARVAIKVKERILFINLSDVVAVRAEGNYVSLQRNGSSYLLRESISAVAEKLEPQGFIRIHRSILVNASFVEEIRPCSTGEYGLRVKGGKEYTVTRTYKKNLKSLAEFWIGCGRLLPGPAVAVTA
jgi:DNA-binding LytR/AlgR family response regulator